MNDKYHSLKSLKTLIVSLLVAICLISSCNIKSNKVDKKEKADTFITSLGKEYAIAEPSGKMLEQYLEAKKNFESIDYNNWQTSVECKFAIGENTGIFR